MSIIVTTNNGVETVTPVEGSLAYKAEAVAKSDPNLESDNSEQEADESAEVSEASENEASDSEQSESDSRTEDDKEVKTESSKKKLGGFQKKLAKKDQEIDFWKQEALKAKSQEQRYEPEPVREASKSKEGRPKAEDFDSHEDYNEAVVKWAIAEDRKSYELKSQAEKVKEARKSLVQSYNDKVEKFIEEQPDFVDVMEELGDYQISEFLQHSILESDNGPRLAYELAKNKSELDRISNLPPVAMARELGKLEARFDSKSSNKNTTEIKTTKAPAPVSPVSGKGSVSVSKALNDPTISFAEYERQRMKELNSRR